MSFLFKLRQLLTPTGLRWFSRRQKAGVLVKSTEVTTGHGLLPAPLSSRFLAGLIDFLLFNLCALEIIALICLPVGVLQGRDVAGRFLALVLYFYFLWLYFSLFESSHWQATPGKLVLSIQVTNHQGDRLSWLAASARFLAKLFSLLPCCLGMLWSPFSPQKLALHDRLSQTIVSQMPPKI